MEVVGSCDLSLSLRASHPLRHAMTSCSKTPAPGPLLLGQSCCDEFNGLTFPMLLTSWITSKPAGDFFQLHRQIRLADTIDSLNGVHICRGYIAVRKSSIVSTQDKESTVHFIVACMFCSLQPCFSSECRVRP